MKRPRPWDGQGDVISSDESSSSAEEVEITLPKGKPSALTHIIEIPSRETLCEERLLQRAEIYQRYMKQIPIPTTRGSVIPCDTWMQLGKSLKKLYVQPLHYLTNVLLKQWDQERIGSEDEYQPLHLIIHPVKAETTLWLIEEVHRSNSSHHYLAKLWLQDPNYQAYLDSVVPGIYSNEP